MSYDEIPGTKVMAVQTKKRVPVKPLRVRESKDRLRRRWAGRDRFGVAKAMGQIR